MVHKVLILGHSFVHRLESFTFNNREHDWLNLGFDGTDIQIEFAGLGGGTLRPGPKSIQNEDFMRIVSDYEPDSIFLQIGGNDLNQESDPEKLARDILSYSNYLITCYRVNHVTIGQLIPRYNGSDDYNVKVIAVNKHLVTMTKFQNNITYWKHRGVWKNTLSLLCRDKVHFNQDGMLLYAKNVRAAVGYFLK